MTKEWRNPYRLNFTTVWDEINHIKSRLEKIEAKNELYDEFWCIKTLSELDNLIALIRTELQNYSVVCMSVEKHDK